MPPWDSALGDVVDIMVVLVGDLEESKALNVEISRVDAIRRPNLSANQKSGIVAELLDVISRGDLIDEDPVQIDVHAGIRMPRHFQVVPSFLLDVLDLGEPFPARDAEQDVQVLIHLSHFDGSGGDDVVALVFGGGTINLEARLHC